MQHLVNAFWRTVYRLGYPCARVVWRFTGKPGEGTTIAVWCQGRLLCVRESYRPGLGLPGGGLNPGEAPLAAAQRELFEEVGLEIEPRALRQHGRLAYDSNGLLVDDTLFVVDLEAAPELRVDQREIVWAGFLAPEEIAPADMQRGMRHYLERVGKRAPVAV